MTEKTSTGGCLCGAVRYQFNEPLDEVTACHCSQCRKQTGHYLASVYVDWSKVDVEGEDKVAWYAASDIAERGFCSVCGSFLFWVSPEYGGAIMAGSLDKPTGTHMSSHIFVANKGDYYDIADGLPQYDGLPPDGYESVPADGEG